MTASASAPVNLVFFEVTGSWISVSEPSLASNNSGPRLEPVSGLVTFTPRLPRGASFFVFNHLVSHERNTLQQIFLISNPVRGTWKLSLDGIRTPDLPYSASPADVQAALAALPSVGAGNVSVTTGAHADSFNVEFINALAHTAVTPIVAYSNLYNSANQNCPVEVTTIHQGTPQIVADTAIVLPAVTARIRNGVLCSIDSIDSPGVDLCAAMPELNSPDPLIYDVTFDKVSFDGQNQMIAPFGFVAPPDNTPVCITSPHTQKVPWMPPIAATWTPGTTAAKSLNWRLRSA